MKIFLLMVMLGCLSICTDGQPQPDSATMVLKTDSLNNLRLLKLREDSAGMKYSAVIQRVLGMQHFIDLTPIPVNRVNQERNVENKDVVFYIFCILLLLLGILKVFYTRYFNNIFKVFFNTSLRQNQLTDLLLQAKLPSLIFNLFFVISGGLYVWSLLIYYRVTDKANSYILLASCIAAVGIIYIGKFFSLKFIGWVSGMSAQSDTYIFITFLINKILGIILLPFTIIILFGSAPHAGTFAMVSLLVIAILFLSRYFRSYGLLQNHLQLSLPQFIIYIAGVEIIPLLIIYKAASGLLIS